MLNLAFWLLLGHIYLVFLGLFFLLDGFWSLLETVTNNLLVLIRNLIVSLLPIIRYEESGSKFFVNLWVAGKKFEQEEPEVLNGGLAILVIKDDLMVSIIGLWISQLLDRIVKSLN